MAQPVLDLNLQPIGVGHKLSMSQMDGSKVKSRKQKTGLALDPGKSVILFLILHIFLEYTFGK